MQESYGLARTWFVMLIVIAAIALVWLTIGALVWVACLAAARGDAEQLARSSTARTPWSSYPTARTWRSAPATAERLTLWESLPGMPMSDSKLGAQGAR